MFYIARQTHCISIDTRIAVCIHLCLHTTLFILWITECIFFARKFCFDARDVGIEVIHHLLECGFSHLYIFPLKNALPSFIWTISMCHEFPNRSYIKNPFCQLGKSVYDGSRLHKHPDSHPRSIPFCPLKRYSPRR